MSKPIVNIADLEMKPSQQGTRYGFRAGRIGGVIGCEQLGAQYMVVPAGRAAFQRHAHRNNEEMFVILEGQGRYQRGDESWEVAAGDIIAAPAGDASTAHQLTNTGENDLRYLSISTRHPIDVTEYPDSGKVIVAAEIPPGQGMMSAELVHSWRTGTTPLGYWDGVDTGEEK